MEFTGRLSLLIMVGLIFNTSVGFAATYYVAATGSNSNSCVQARSQLTPKQAINAGVSCLSAGDTLLIGNGRYTERLVNAFSNTGSSWADKITVRAQNNRQVTVAPSGRDSVVSLSTAAQKYIEFDGLVFDGNYETVYVVLIASAAHHIRFQNGALLRANNIVSLSRGATGGADYNEFINMEVAYAAMNADGTLRTCASGGPTDPQGRGKCHALYVSSDNNLMDRLDMHHNNGCGPHLYPGGTNHNNIVRNSVMHDNYNPGVCSIGTDNQIINNVIYNNGGGILVNGGNNLVYNNTVYNNRHADGYGGLTLGGSGHIVKNNIIFQNSPAGAFKLGGTRITLDSTNLVDSDPQFVNAANGNFQLKTGSPAIDAGTALPAVTTDIDGVARPQPQGARYDIGAYEFRGGPPNPPMNLAVN